MSVAAANSDDESSQRVLHKHYNISLTIQLKRGKEEIEFASKETDRLHNLIGTGTEIEWAKNQVATIHKMIFMPDADQIKSELEGKLDNGSNTKK